MVGVLTTQNTLPRIAMADHQQEEEILSRVAGQMAAGLPAGFARSAPQESI